MQLMLESVDFIYIPNVHLVLPSSQSHISDRPKILRCIRKRKQEEWMNEWYPALKESSRLKRNQKSKPPC